MFLSCLLPSQLPASGPSHLWLGLLSKRNDLSLLFVLEPDLNLPTIVQLVSELGFKARCV